MKPNRAWIRALLGIILVAACAVAAIVPILPGVEAAPPEVSSVPGDIVISNFRFHGLNGINDQFIEIFNRSCTTSQDMTGWEIRSSVGSLTSVIYSFPSGTTLDAGQYWLIATSGAGGYAGASDGTYSNPIDDLDGGVGIFRSSADIPSEDEVGLNGNSDSYHEGTALEPLTTNVNRSYVRRTTAAGMYVDTNKNSRDFIIQNPSQPHTNKSLDVGQCGTPTVTIKGSTGTGNATLSYTDITAQTATSDATGNYTLTVSANFTGTVTPSKSGITFKPASKKYTNLLQDLTGEDYTALASTPTSSFHPPVMINEVAWYGTIANYTNDWIELKNNTNADINLDGWTLEAQDGSPSIELRGTIPADGYFLLANAGYSSYATNTPTPAASPPCIVFRTSDHVTINQYFYGDLSYAGETLFLVNSSNAVIDYANRNGGAWPAGSTTNRASMERHGVIPDSDIAWYTYVAPQGPVKVHDCSGNRVYGTPGYANWATTVTATPSPVPTKYRTATPRPPTPFGHMVINEFLPRAGYDWNQDGKVDVFDEFVELKNLGPVDATLSGWKISVLSTEGDSTYTIPSNTKLTTDQRIVFYGLTTKLSLYDSGATVRIINSRGVVVDARSYGPVQAPDQSTCRLPDGFYWRFPCFPTPGNENSLTGTHPAVPPVIAPLPPPCLMSDIIPAPFRDAECYPFGADVYNPAYWDDQAGFRQFPVPDVISKWRAVVE